MVYFRAGCLLLFLVVGADRVVALHSAEGAFEYAGELCEKRQKDSEFTTLCKEIQSNIKRRDTEKQEEDGRDLKKWRLDELELIKDTIKIYGK